MKITVDVTDPELNAMEDSVTVRFLCQKHLQKMKATESEMNKWERECKACLATEAEAHKKTLHLWSKLVHAYNIAKYGECKHDRTRKHAKGDSKKFISLEALQRELSN